MPGKPVGTLTGQDVYVIHLATISCSRKHVVCEPTADKISRFVDDIVTDGFVTDTEPLILDVSPTHLEAASLEVSELNSSWGDVVKGEPSHRAFSV